MSAHQTFPVTEFAGILRSRPLDFRLHNPRSDRACDLVRHFVLDGKNVLQSTIVAISPDVMSIGGLNQLRVDANAIPKFSNAAFEHIMNAKLASYLANVDRLTLIGKGGVARDDEQPTRSGQHSDDIVGDAISKILLFGIAAHVLEG